MILSNQVVCMKCKAEPYSAHRHDYVGCECKDPQSVVCVDGGMDYLKRTYGPAADYRDISIEISQEDYDALAGILDDTKNNWNTLGKVCALARYMRDEMDLHIGLNEVEK